MANYSIKKEEIEINSLWQKREKTINEYLNILGKALDSLEKCEHEDDYMSFNNTYPAKTVYEYIYKCTLVIVNGLINIWGETSTIKKGKCKPLDYYRDNIKSDNTTLRYFNTLHNMAFICGCRNNEILCSHLELTLDVLKDFFFHFLNYTNRLYIEKSDKTNMGKVALQFAKTRLSQAVELKKKVKIDKKGMPDKNQIEEVMFYHILNDGITALENACQLIYGDEDYYDSDLENEISIIQHNLIIDHYPFVVFHSYYVNNCILKPYRKVLKMFKQELSDAASTMRHDDPRSGLEKALEDVEKGRVRSAKNVRDLMEQIFKK